MRVMFVEPPKDFWFVMGEYLPPPLGILELAGYLEAHNDRVEINVLDCQAEGLDWKGLERQIESFRPDILAPSALSTCNAYTGLRTTEVAKKINPETITVVGGQHFTATAQESLDSYPEIDLVVRGEGEVTFAEIVEAVEKQRSFAGIGGLSFRHDGKVVHNPQRPPITNLDDLPFPGYHFVKDQMKKYHFTMMAGPKASYALIEASRGCPHRCTFCSQWRFWDGIWRSKSPKRIVDEMEHCYREYGSTFLWLTDDNLGLGRRTDDVCDEILRRGIGDDIMWFAQARCDDIIHYSSLLPKMRRAGNLWLLVGVESGDATTLDIYRKGIRPSDAKLAINLMKEQGIFAQATFIIGERKDSHESIARLRAFVNDADPELAIFMVLTPFPGTELYDVARRNGWIEDTNWTHYDMTHAIMPTEHLTRAEVQEELFECYRGFYGNIRRRISGIFASNPFKRRTYTYLASQGIIKALRDLF